MSYRIGIQVLSYKKPDYLRKTLESLVQVVSDKDRICVIEQSDDKEGKLQEECIEICKEFPNIETLPLFKNFGQRGAINTLYGTGFWNDCRYMMITDHDNIFHEKLDVYVELLDNIPSVWIATGYHSPEHDVEDKYYDCLIKSTARAGHMVMRVEDFKTVMPTDPKAGSSAWFAGLDWWLTHWAPNAPGHKRSGAIWCYPGGVEHIGRESTWQGHYDDEYSLDELRWIRKTSLYDVIHKHPPRHSYVDQKYWYEKISDDEFKKECLKDERRSLHQTPIEREFEEQPSEIKIIDENNKISVKNIRKEIEYLKAKLEEKYSKKAVVDDDWSSFLKKIKDRTYTSENLYAKISEQFPKFKESYFKSVDLPIDTYLHTEEERRVIASIVEQIPQGGSFLEIGSWAAYNLIMVKIIRPDIDVYGCDPYFLDHPDYGPPDPQTRVVEKGIDLSNIYVQALQNLSKSRLFSAISLMRARSSEILNIFPNYFFDVIYIDGDHHYTSITQDIILSSSKLKKNGILFGHDSALEEDIIAALAIKSALNDINVSSRVFKNLIVNVFDYFGESRKQNGIWIGQIKE